MGFEDPGIGILQDQRPQGQHAPAPQAQEQEDGILETQGGHLEHAGSLMCKCITYKYTVKIILQ